MNYKRPVFFETKVTQSAILVSLGIKTSSCPNLILKVWIYIYYLSAINWEKRSCQGSSLFVAALYHLEKGFELLLDNFDNSPEQQAAVINKMRFLFQSLAHHLNVPISSKLADWISAK